MAVVNPTGPIQLGVGQADGSVQMWTWVLTTADTTGEAIEIPEWANQTWSFKASATGTATAAIQGSNTNVEADFAAQSNLASGTAITTTSVPICVTANENPRFVRPKLTTAGTAATWTITLCARRANPMRQ